jgi:hypothetical protein
MHWSVWFLVGVLFLAGLLLMVYGLNDMQQLLGGFICLGLGIGTWLTELR